MKLRIRSMETKETTRIEVPDSSSLFQLKTLMASKLSISPPQSIALSLNRRDEFVSSTPAASLPSLGLTSGDLLFYSSTANFNAPETTPSASNPPPPIPQRETPNPDGETLGEAMEVDGEKMSALPEKSYSIPGFLKRVMDVEKDEIKGNLGFLVVGIHAVFLESGFVVCNDGVEDESRLPKAWNSATAFLAVQYTMPELLVKVRKRVAGVRVAALKFSALRNQVSVYGSLAREPGIYRLQFDLATLLSVLLYSDEKEVFEFWKTVKDRLCLPLMIDVCEKNGLPLPPCFARLPTDLKLKVLELLPGADIAKVGCTGSEMRYVGSNEELWKQKFLEEFGPANEKDVAGLRSWKQKFKRCWKKRKEAENARIELQHMQQRARRRMGLPSYGPFGGMIGDRENFPVRMVQPRSDNLQFPLRLVLPGSENNHPCSSRMVMPESEIRHPSPPRMVMPEPDNNLEVENYLRSLRRGRRTSFSPPCHFGEDSMDLKYL